MALVNYSSSSDSDDSESNDDDQPPAPKMQKMSNPTKRLPLPLPSCIRDTIKEFHEKPADNPDKHNGRVRRFGHQRGNWTTYVYIPVQNDCIEDLQSQLKKFLKGKLDLKPNDDNHISLTKTVILRHHWIDSFVQTIHETLQSIDEFTVAFSNLKIYCNEDRSRTFLGVSIDLLYATKLEKLVSKMDNVMEEFRLEKFYENPSYHTSILWCVGDQEAVLKENLSAMQQIFDDMLEKYPVEFQLKINTIICKIGNKKFSFSLSR